jgi:Fe-S oxidoreductase
MSAPSHENALELCTYCPKLCRFSCPVSEATQRETLTPRDKMATLARAESQGFYPSESAAETPYACTGCARCSDYCRHGVDVTASLVRGRRLARIQRQDAPAVRRAESRFVERAPRLATLLRDWPKEGQFQFHPGCSSIAAPSLVDDARAVFSALLPEQVGAPRAPACCGFPLYAAGALDAFREHARRVAQSLSVQTMIVGDPGCAHTFKVLYPEHGAPLPCAVQTLPEALAEKLPAQPTNPSPAPRYHDACSLGRKLGVYEAPRQMLTWAAGGPPIELGEHHHDAPCSGGGALLPLSAPEMARAIARDAVQLADETAPEAPLVTACPTARRQFAKAGAESVDFIHWIRRALGV